MGAVELNISSSNRNSLKEQKQQEDKQQIQASAAVLPLSDWQTGPLSLPWHPETGIPRPVATFGHGESYNSSQGWRSSPAQPQGHSFFHQNMSTFKEDDPFHHLPQLASSERFKGFPLNHSFFRREKR